MRRLISVLFVLACFAAPACEKVDQAFEAVDKAKTIKDDVEKKVQGFKKDVQDIVGGAKKDAGPEPDREEGRERAERKKGEGHPQRDEE